MRGAEWKRSSVRAAQGGLCRLMVAMRPLAATTRKWCVADRANVIVWLPSVIVSGQAASLTGAVDVRSPSDEPLEPRERLGHRSTRVPHPERVRRPVEDARREDHHALGAGELAGERADVAPGQLDQADRPRPWPRPAERLVAGDEVVEHRQVRLDDPA